MMPNFFIVGAARSGTTSLHRYLGQHPDIFVAQVKEPHFFAADQFPAYFTGPGDDRLNRRVCRDEGQYEQLFVRASDKPAVGESSAFYLCYPHAAERIARACSDPKIIILLRNPVDRAYSAYMYLVRDGRETLSFEDALSCERARKAQGFEPMWWHTELSLYYEQVKQYLEVFGVERTKVLLYDDLCSNPAELLQDVLRFLGLRDDISIDTSVRYNTAGVPRSRTLYALMDTFLAQPHALKKHIKTLLPSSLSTTWVTRAMNLLVEPVPMNPQLSAQLHSLFAQDVRKLEDLLSRDLQCWAHQEHGVDQTEAVARLVE